MELTRKSIYKRCPEKFARSYKKNTNLVIYVAMAPRPAVRVIHFNNHNNIWIIWPLLIWCPEIYNTIKSFSVWYKTECTYLTFKSNNWEAPSWQMRNTSKVIHLNCDKNEYRHLGNRSSRFCTLCVFVCWHLTFQFCLVVPAFYQHWVTPPIWHTFREQMVIMPKTKPKII